jgi:hypothetical protein
MGETSKTAAAADDGTRIVHKMKGVSVRRGSVSSVSVLCFSKGRTLDANRETASLFWDSVTCPVCLKKKEA